MFAGFDEIDIEVPDGQDAGGVVTIHGVVGGHGRPVLLLHGFPQSHAMWHRVAPVLAETHTVVATDLRGYGDSGQVDDRADHSGYSFRNMAADQVEVMKQLGFERFAVIGHDRGARVTHRLALDHPTAVDRLALLDIMPTAWVYSHVDRFLATAYYHWFFFIQPFDLPERLIGADPIWYVRRLLGGWGSGLEAHDPSALAEYERAFADPDVRHAMLEDYRAGASVDLSHDAESEAAGRGINAPTLVLWGTYGVVARAPGGPLEVWKTRADDPNLVQGRAIDGAGHFLVEDNFGDTLAALRQFLTPR